MPWYQEKHSSLMEVITLWYKGNFTVMIVATSGRSPLGHHGLRHVLHVDQQIYTEHQKTADMLEDKEEALAELAEAVELVELVEAKDNFKRRLYDRKECEETPCLWNPDSGK
jgi:hypothetical protein